MTQGERLKRARKGVGLSRKYVAEKLGISQQAIYKYENGMVDNIPKDRIEKLSELYGVSVTYLMGLGDELKTVDIVFDDYFPLHYYTNLSAGLFDDVMDSEPDGVVYVPIAFQHKKSLLEAFKINGNSMNNVFADGTIVVCEKVTNKENIKNGDIVVALLDGYTNIKRFYESEGVVSLVPDSKDKSFMPIIINPKVQNLRILGKVIWHMNPDDIMKTY